MSRLPGFSENAGGHGEQQQAVGAVFTGGVYAVTHRLRRTNVYSAGPQAGS